MIAIADVRVVDRYRADLGDIDGLATSLRELGQLQPIVVNSGLRLIAGGRRIAAAQSLGWTVIEAKIVDDLNDAASLLRAEKDENTCRKSFTLTEEHSLYQALLDLQLAATAGEKTAAARVTGKDRSAIAQAVSGSASRHKTLEKIGEVKRIAHSDSHSETLRQVAAEALVEMDRTGNVSGPRMRVRIAERAEVARNDTDVSTWSAEEQQLHRQLRSGRTVVVSLRENHAKLVRWAQSQGLLITVDRSTEWGNPFEMPYDGDRDTVIRHYAEYYLPHKPSLLSRLTELRGKALACWCAPEPCHADILQERSENL